MTNKTKAAIEEAAKLPTAEETLEKTGVQMTDFISSSGYSGCIAAIESHTQAHTEGLIKERDLHESNADFFQVELCKSNELLGELRERVKELETATNKALEILERRRQTTPGLGAPIIILKTALEDRT